MSDGHASIEVDVLVVGAGPTGLALAGILGMHGVRTLLVERNASTVSEPRAVSIDDESLRTLQYLGLYDEVEPRLMRGYGSYYYSAAGRCFARVVSSLAEYGFPRRSAFRQPVLEAQLRQGLARYASVHTRFETRLVSFEDSPGGVSALLEDLRSPGTTSTVRARYLVGADGGRSLIREALGVQLSGATYDQRWLIVDLEGSVDPFRHTRVYCDPARPALALPGPENTRRYEFMTLPDDRDDELLTDSSVRALLARHSRADAQLTIVRKVIYHFHARIADRWRVGRVFLAGDAAHLTPPFAGQGMNSGMRDAHNLGWKLAAVIQGRLGEGVLDTYQSERRPHARQLIQMAVNMGQVMMPRSRWHAFLVQTGLRLLSLYPPARDYVMQMKYKPKPQFEQGLVTGLAGGQLRGRMFIQPMVERSDGSQRPLDEMIGTGFAVIEWQDQQALHDAPGRALACAPLPLDAIRLGLLRRDERFIGECPGNRSGAAPAPLLARDVTGALAQTLDAARVRGVIVRPDRYVAAAIASDAPAGEAARLLEALRAQAQAPLV
jgi:3-(3-hydroxy-phenyl)propionate hydroxylase